LGKVEQENLSAALVTIQNLIDRIS
jgi:hypothetical protein